VNKTKKIALAAAALCASFSALAQDAVINPSWYIQPSVNAMKPDSDFGMDKRGYGAGLKFGKPVNEFWDMQIGTTYARSRENGNRYQQNTLGVDGLYMFSRKTFRPFILLGVGAERDKTNLPPAKPARIRHTSAPAWASRRTSTTASASRPTSATCTASSVAMSSLTARAITTMSPSA
jgi:hypothetical protein